jgi:hypothetical protein
VAEVGYRAVLVASTAAVVVAAIKTALAALERTA